MMSVSCTQSTFIYGLTGLSHRFCKIQFKFPVQENEYVGLSQLGEKGNDRVQVQDCFICFALFFLLFGNLRMHMITSCIVYVP